jgi:hypothetical protein
LNVTAAVSYTLPTTVPVGTVVTILSAQASTANVRIQGNSADALPGGGVNDGSGELAFATLLPGTLAEFAYTFDTAANANRWVRTSAIAGRVQGDLYFDLVHRLTGVRQVDAINFTERAIAVVQSSAVSLNLATGTYFTLTASAGALGFTLGSPPANNRVLTVTLEIANGGLATTTWPASFRWSGGSAPALQNSGVDVVVATTRDGGTTWRAALAYTGT